MFTLLPFVAVSSAFGTLLKNCSQHLYYKDSGGEIHELWWQNSKGWKHINITKQINAPPSLSDPVGYCGPTGEYLYYYSTDKHIYQLYRSDTRYKFRCTDITVQAHLSVEPVGELIVWPLASTEHLFFRDIDGKIRELFYVPVVGWSHSNLTDRVSVPYVESRYDIPYEEDEEDDDVKQLMEEFEESHITTNLMYSQFSPNTNNESHSGRSIEELLEAMKDYLTQEKQALEANNEKTLSKIKKAKSGILREIKSHLRQKNLLTGNICGHISTPSQYLFFAGMDNHLHLIRHGPSLFSEIKRDDPTITKPSDDSWWSYTYNMAKGLVEGVSNTLTAIQLQWSRHNITKYSSFYTADMNSPFCIVGTPTSHSTTSHSQHVFCIDFPHFHLHEFAWYSSNWEHKDLTNDKIPPISPQKGLSSYSTNLYQFVYCSDFAGRLYELRRKIGDDSWIFCDIQRKIKDLPPVHEICSTASLGLTNSVIYYKDTGQNIIELACTWDITMTTSKWYWKNLSTLPRFLPLPKPSGKVLSYSKGLMESMSTVSQNTLSYVMSFTGSDNTQNELVSDDEDDDAEILRQFNEHKKLIEQQSQESNALRKKIQEYSDRAKQEYEEKRKHQEEIAKGSIQDILREFLSKEEFSVTTRRIVTIQALWRKVLAKKKYKQLVKKYNQRAKIAQEILTTERNYVEALQICLELYIQPLTKMAFISHETAHVIFCNLDYKIIRVHKALLSQLESRMKNWYANQQLGDVFLEMMEELQSYSNYVGNYNNALQMIDKLCKENVEFDTFLEAARSVPRCNHLGLTDYLIMPVQRLPRYELLLIDLLKHTPVECPDHAHLKQAVEKIKTVTSTVNERKRALDSRARLEELEDQTEVVVLPLVKLGRTIVREGTIQIIGSLGKEQKMTIVLLNDAIVCFKPRKTIILGTEKKMRMHTFIPLDVLVIEEVGPDDVKKEPEFCIKVLPSPNGKSDILFKKKLPYRIWKFPSLPEKASWLKDIRTGIEKAKKHL